MKLTASKNYFTVLDENGHVACMMNAEYLGALDAKVLALKFAAAPEMLKALKPFAEYLKHPMQPIMSVIRPEEWDRVAAAVKKAETGE